MQKLALAVMASASLALGGCGDGTGPGANLSASEAAALAAALAPTGAFSGGASGYASLVFAQLQTVGSMSTSASGALGAPLAPRPSLSGGGAASVYDAVGVQVQYTVRFGSNIFTGTSTSVVGWTGFDADARTVAEVVSMGVYDQEGDFPTGFEGTVESDDVAGFYRVASSNSNYVADTGTFDLNSATFGSADTCPNLGNLGAQITVNECSLRLGTMTGNLGFTATKFIGSGASTYTQPTLSFDVPAIRMLFDITVPQN